MQFGERNLLHYSVRWDSGYLYGIRSPHIGEGWLIITNFHGTIVMEVWLSWSHLLHVGSPDQKELTKGVKHSLHLCHFSNRSDEHKAERSKHRWHQKNWNGSWITIYEKSNWKRQIRKNVSLLIIAPLIIWRGYNKAFLFCKYFTIYRN